MDIWNQTMLVLLVLLVGLTSESAAVSSHSFEQVGIPVGRCPNPYCPAVQLSETSIESSGISTARLLESDVPLLAIADARLPQQIRVIQIDARHFVLDLIKVDQATTAR